MEVRLFSSHASPPARSPNSGLNTPSTSSHAIRPVDIISSLSNHSPGKHNSLFSSREHQDAQELFQLLSECVKTETVAVAKEIRRDRGLGGLTQSDERSSRDVSKTVFDGLTANRRSCVQCGYTEAVMHFPFDNWQLAVPRLKVRSYYQTQFGSSLTWDRVHVDWKSV